MAFLEVDLAQQKKRIARSTRGWEMPACLRGSRNEVTCLNETLVDRGGARGMLMLASKPVFCCEFAVELSPLLGSRTGLGFLCCHVAFSSVDGSVKRTFSVNRFPGFDPFLSRLPLGEYGRWTLER